MKSWTFLPNEPLTAKGRDSEALAQVGCNTYQSAAQYLQQLRYGRNSDRSDYHLVLSEKRGTCSTKHALLASVAKEQNLQVFLTVGIYEMNESNTPGIGKILASHGLASLPEAHCYLTYEGERVDITWPNTSPEENLLFFHQEWRIQPPQIGEHKAQLHKQFLQQWLNQKTELSLTLEEAWRIRESCILALSAA